MKRSSIDGIASRKTNKPPKTGKFWVSPQVVVSVSPAPDFVPAATPGRFSGFGRMIQGAVLSVGLLAAFFLGVWYQSVTPPADAESFRTSFEPVPLGQAVLVGESSEIDSDLLFRTPLWQLRSYFAPPPEPDILAERTEKIREFLQAKRSPLSSAAPTIAKQDHWKLILAIAFAESTLGKNCHSKNCSNIGVAPGHRLWRTYSTYDDWVEDFNSLLERRYKDKTLEQMCGVYVQPCNANWLLATRQILSELQEAGVR